MKYIKTKDGVFEVVIEDDEIEMYQVKRRFASVEYKDVIAKSDNLETLFDECVMENEDHTYQTLLQSLDRKIPIYGYSTKDVKDGWIYSCDKYLSNGCEIYGAIIVRGIRGEPILMPVAKMTIDGDWKLL